MDATISLAGLIEEFNRLLGAQDYEGAEELLACSFGQDPKTDCYLHYQLGRMYVSWNKLTSAVNHLFKAAELAKSNHDELMVLQVIEELKTARKRQAAQAP